MTEPTSHYPVPPPPPVSPWIAQDPYAPYAGSHARSPGEPDPDRPDGPGPEAMPPYEPYAGGPPSGQPYEPYAGGPGYSGSPGPAGLKPTAYWPLSIVGVLFSFLFGAIAIYFSIQVGRRWNRGDVDGAHKASQTARTLGFVAIVVGVIVTTVLLAVDSR